MAERPWLPAELCKFANGGWGDTVTAPSSDNNVRTRAASLLLLCYFLSDEGMPESLTLKQHASFAAGDRAPQICTTVCPRRRTNAPAPMP